MKVKVSNFLAPAAILFLLTFSAKAQDALPVIESADPLHRELNLGEDKPLIYDHPSHLSTYRDTIQVTPRVPQALTVRNAKPDNHKNNKKEKDEEDALSYNFIYYMFQKFKMSDWIDQN